MYFWKGYNGNCWHSSSSQAGEFCGSQSESPGHLASTNHLQEVNPSKSVLFKTVSCHGTIETYLMLEFWSEAEFLDFLRVLRVFSPCYSQSSLLTDFTPLLPSKSGLKLVCNIKIVYGNLNETVRSWIRLQEIIVAYRILCGSLCDQRCFVVQMQLCKYVYTYSYI